MAEPVQLVRLVCREGFSFSCVSLLLVCLPAENEGGEADLTRKHYQLHKFGSSFMFYCLPKAQSDIIPL